MRLTALGEDREESFEPTLVEAVEEYESRDATRVDGWNTKFNGAPVAGAPSDR